MKELLKKIREELMDRIKEILSSYPVIVALKIIAVLIGIASVAGIGYGIYKYQYYRGEIVWTDNYKLEDIGDQDVVVVTSYVDGQGVSSYRALMDKKGRVKVITRRMREDVAREIDTEEMTALELYDYYMQDDSIPYHTKTVEVNEDTLTALINLKEVELTEEFSRIMDFPRERWYIVHGSGEDREMVLVAEFFTTRRENRRKELEPILDIVGDVSIKMPQP